MGPPLIKGDFASGKILKNFMLGGFPGGMLPRLNVAVVDVREVASAHLQAIKRDEAQN